MEVKKSSTSNFDESKHSTCIKQLRPEVVLTDYDNNNPDLTYIRSIVSNSYNILNEKNSTQLNNGITRFAHLKHQYISDNLDKSNNNIKKTLNDKLSALF